MKALSGSLIVLAVIAAGGYLAFDKVRQETRSKGADWEATATARLQSIEDVIEANGFVYPVHSTTVRSEVSGRVTRIFVLPGEKVERDQILVELDRVALEKELIESERNLEAERLRLIQSQREYEQLKHLRGRGIVDDFQYWEAETRLRLAELQVEVQQARVDRVRDNLERTTIRAPQAGTISDLDINEGQVIIGATSVSEGTRLMTVHDLSRLYVRLQVNELDIERLRPDDPAQLTFEALPGVPMQGRVDQIHPFAFNQDNIQVFRVDVSFDPGEKPVRPGISANVRIVHRRVENAVAVILSAVFLENGSPVVYLRNQDGTMAKQPVEVGIRDTQWVEILSGLQAGDVVSLTRPGWTSGDF